MTASETASFAEFAELLRVKRSYITELKKSDRLVLTDDGKSVQVAESIARIRATADPSKAGVVARHAAERGTSVGQGATTPDAPVTDAVATASAADPDADPDAVDPQGGPDYQSSRARREHYQALEAKRVYEVAIGKLMDAGEVATAVASATTTLRTRLEGLPDVLGPQLAAINDEAQARATLAEAIEHALDEAAREFASIAKQVAA